MKLKLMVRAEQGALQRVLVPAAIGRRRAGTSLLFSAVVFIGYLIWAPLLAEGWHVAGLALAASIAFGRRSP